MFSKFFHKDIKLNYTNNSFILSFNLNYNLKNFISSFNFNDFVKLIINSFNFLFDKYSILFVINNFIINLKSNNNIINQYVFFEPNIIIDLNNINLNLYDNIEFIINDIDFDLIQFYYYYENKKIINNFIIFEKFIIILFDNIINHIDTDLYDELKMYYDIHFDFIFNIINSNIIVNLNDFYNLI